MKQAVNVLVRVFSQALHHKVCDRPAMPVIKIMLAKLQVMLDMMRPDQTCWAFEACFVTWRTILHAISESSACEDRCCTVCVSLWLVSQLCQLKQDLQYLQYLDARWETLPAATINETDTPFRRTCRGCGACLISRLATVLALAFYTLKVIIP